MGDNLDTECAGSVLDFSDRIGICKPLPMQISEIERQLYVVRRELGDICIMSLRHLGVLYEAQQQLARESAEYEANHDQ